MKPQIVKEWEESMKVMEDMCPKCCHTCFEMKDGVCCEFASPIPPEFQEKIDGCEKWNRSAF